MDKYTLLSEFIEEYRNQPFEWGVVDCMQVTRAWTTRLTGVDPCPELKDYSTSLGAYRTLRALGFETLEDALDAHFERRPSGFAQRGDFASFKSANSEEFPVAVGICCGAESAFLGESGLMFNATSECLNFWKVE